MADLFPDLHMRLMLHNLLLPVTGARTLRKARRASRLVPANTVNICCMQSHSYAPARTIHIIRCPILFTLLVQNEGNVV